MKNFLRVINEKLDAKGGFLKSVSILVGGTAFSQGIAIIALPFLTRLYSPSDFSLFAVYTSLVMTISVASCLRFEIAIPIPQSDTEATNLVALALMSNLLITFLIFVLVYLFHLEFITVLKKPNFGSLIWLVPVGIFLIGTYNTFQYWATREKKFTVIAKTRMIQSMSGVGVQVSMGILGFSALGLVLGQILRFSAGLKGLGINFWRSAQKLLPSISSKSLIATFKKNQNFPKYSALESLANSAGIQLPVILIASVVGGSEAGFLMLAMQVMTIPIAFIGNAVSQVYLAHASEKFQEGNLKSYTLECVSQLSKVGLLPLALISVASPFLFPLIFGEVWLRAGEMVVWLFPWYAVQLIVSPVSMALHIINFQKIALFLQLAGLLIRLGGLFLVSLNFPQFSFEYYAISGFVFYLLFFFVVLSSIRYAERRQAEIC